MSTDIDASTPVLIGWHAVSRRDADPRDGREAAALMADAAYGALADIPGAQVDWIGATAGLTSYADPARLVGEQIGAPGAHTVLAHIGVMQQTLISTACRAVQSGRHRLALVVGAEAHYRKVRAAAAGQPAPVTVQPDGVSPGETMTSPGFDEAMANSAEAAVGLAATPPYYALLDSFWRGEQGRGIDEHRDDLARVYARFAAIAADNPQAVRRGGVTAEELRDPSEHNPMIAFPYTKLMVTTWTVDQGCALLFTTAGVADELGVPRSRWRFPVLVVDSHHVVPMSARTRLSQPAAMALVGETIRQRTGLDPADIDLVDLYSAFPAPVFIAAQCLGIPAGRDLTLTGGMSFAGGPLNSYTFHAIAAAADQLGGPQARAALIGCVSGYYSKQGALVLSAEPLAPFDTVDITAAVAEAEPALPVHDDAQGQGRIVAYTVVPGDPAHAVAVIDLADGGRAVGRSEDTELVATGLGHDLLGAAVTIRAGVFELLDSP